MHQKCVKEVFFKTVNVTKPIFTPQQWWVKVRQIRQSTNLQSEKLEAFLDYTVHYYVVHIGRPYIETYYASARAVKVEAEEAVPEDNLL